ncbi:hypothetical protein CcaverHIS002_0405300 [Cutaneotrichosporon cavernicola]|uniref:PIG-F-domain-containing protein n=1 Tax=Cutaneotrichosporon cavernicola TaxID=279322 RepID=A0AA48L4B4_9TREE|nr:uncharacterized protein CcaverHIS019_0405270 [Cutaneotrichosporon cavernicola]BEI83926.1 hypothetical protein CcaverHIS002_0405300 [Cutaneotrichosporon cavernicola]BEI91707.1 hypothetical protein CcaverHIS019_0405270 [Cutaneotrichosporon cavernicola]BEI99481.1 hypothetical protein CcaverHIS631_0405240 [Cutaneotrichosporon cavernicola]BEJ07259.1 hypothetical protein CcaverHIS641_0405280 [Cutaneotrichosporon cavernicola]
MFKLPRRPRPPKIPLAPPGSFALHNYFSALGYLALLLGSCIVVLPRSTDYFYPGGHHSQSTSSDRPEHPWLTPITAHPAGTAAWCAAGVAITMMWWGAKMARWWGTPETFGERSRDAILATAGTAILLLNAITLLGVPVSHILESALLSLTLALLTAWPIVYVLGIPSLYDDGIVARWRLTRLVCATDAHDSKERALAFPLAGTLIGAWVGAIPLALDWDRPWQSWPLTPLVGSLVGFVAGGYWAFIKSALTALHKDIADEQAAEAAAADVAKAPARKRKNKTK